MRWLPDGSPHFGPADIRIWRATERLTQAQACVFFGVSRRRLAYWEAGKMVPAAFQQRLRRWRSIIASRIWRGLQPLGGLETLRRRADRERFG